MAVPASQFDGWFNNDKYSDLVIHCQGKVFKVHRIVLAARCKFFDRCCSGGFSVSSISFRSKCSRANKIQEESSSFIIMDDDDPVDLENLLRYLYTLDPTKLKWLEDQMDVEDAKSLHLIDMYVLADKYEVPTLQAWLIKELYPTEWISANACAQAFLRIADLPTLNQYVPLRDVLLSQITWSDTEWSGISLPYDESSTDKTHSQQSDAASTANTIEEIARNPQAALYLIKHLGAEARKGTPRD